MVNKHMVMKLMWNLFNNIIKIMKQTKKIKNVINLNV